MKPVATCLALLVVPACLCTAQVTTSQYDNARTGATLNEKILTPQNVNAQLIGKLGAFKVDARVRSASFRAQRGNFGERHARAG